VRTLRPGVCENCAPGIPPAPFTPGTCQAVVEYQVRTRNPATSQPFNPPH